jgi:hypothetical protein
VVVADVVEQEDHADAGDDGGDELGVALRSEAVDGGPTGVVGDHQPADEVQQQARATGEREDHEGDPEHDGVDAEVPAEATGQTGDDLVVGRPGEPFRRRIGGRRGRVRGDGVVHGFHEAIVRRSPSILHPGRPGWIP